MTGKLSEHRLRIGLEHQDVAANDSVEGPLEHRLGGIALAESDVPTRLRVCFETDPLSLCLLGLARQSGMACVRRRAARSVSTRE